MLQLGDPYPLLISFVPTHHATQFDGTLSDLVLAHLDPDLVIDWRAWCNELVKAALDPRGPRLVRERTLLSWPSIMTATSMTPRPWAPR